MNRALMMLSPILVLGPALTCIAPRCMAPLLMAFGIFALIADYFANKQLPKPDKHLLAVFGGLIAYGALTHFWTISPDATWEKAGQMLGTFGLVPFIAPMIARFSSDDLHRLSKLLLVGVSLGLAVFLTELWDGFQLYELTHPGNHDPVDSKQNKAIVLIAFWLMALVPYLLLKGTQKQRALFMAMVTLTIYGTLATHSSTAQMLSLAIPAGAFIIWMIPGRTTLRLALAACLLLIIAMPFLAVGIYKHTNWKNSAYLPGSLQSRIEIWNQAASRTFEKPIFGWGLDSAPDLPNRDDRSLLYDGEIHHLHPHNGPLQVWFELGAIGVAFFCVLFFLLYRRISNLNIIAQKYAVFSSVSIFLYTLSIWGIWQSWFMASLCFAGLMVFAGVRYTQKQTAL